MRVNNAAWDSASKVRQRWLTSFLARRTPPKDAAQWTTVTLASCAHEVRRAMEDGHATALRLLGLAEVKGGVGQWRPYAGVPHPVVVAAGKATPARAQVLTLGLLVGGLEASLDRGTWRSATVEQKAYFTALRDWGYELSEVEQLVLEPTPNPEPPTPADPADQAGRDGEGDQVGAPTDAGDDVGAEVPAGEVRESVSASEDGEGAGLGEPVADQGPRVA